MTGTHDANAQDPASSFVPNLATEIAVLASSAVGWAVLTAATLSFLGFGVTLPSPDWGVDLAAGGQYLGTAWWVSTFPGLAITATILLSNFLGDYVGSILDPRRIIRVRRPGLRHRRPNTTG